MDFAHWDRLPPELIPQRYLILDLRTLLQTRDQVCAHSTVANATATRWNERSSRLLFEESKVPKRFPRRLIDVCGRLTDELLIRVSAILPAVVRVMDRHGCLSRPGTGLRMSLRSNEVGIGRGVRQDRGRSSDRELELDIPNRTSTSLLESLCSNAPKIVIKVRKNQLIMTASPTM